MDLCWWSQATRVHGPGISGELWLSHSLMRMFWQCPKYNFVEGVAVIPHYFMRAHINHQVLWGDIQIKLALHVWDDGCLKDHPHQYQPLSWWQMLVSRIMVGFIEVWYFTKNISPATRWCLPVPDRVPTTLQLLLFWLPGWTSTPRPAVSHFARLARWGSRFWQDILETRTQSHAHTPTNGWVIQLIHLPPSSPSRHYQLVGQSVATSSLPDPKIMLDKMPKKSNIQIYIYMYIYIHIYIYMWQMIYVR